MGGEDEGSDRGEEPDNGSGEGAGSEPKEVGQPEVFEVGEDGIARGGIFRGRLDPAEEVEWGGPEEVAESAPAQAGPDEVEEGEQGEDEDGDAPVMGFGAIGGDEFCVLSQARDEADGQGDEPGADDEAAGDGGFAEADEAGAELAGFGDLATGVDEVA